MGSDRQSVFLSSLEALQAPPASKQNTMSPSRQRSACRTTNHFPRIQISVGQYTAAKQPSGALGPTKQLDGWDRNSEVQQGEGRPQSMGSLSRQVSAEASPAPHLSIFAQLSHFPSLDSSLSSAFVSRSNDELGRSSIYPFTKWVGGIELTTAPEAAKLVVFQAWQWHGGLPNPGGERSLGHAFIRPPLRGETTVMGIGPSNIGPSILLVDMQLAQVAALSSAVSADIPWFLTPSQKPSRTSESFASTR